MTCAGVGVDWFAFDAGATASAGRQATEYKRDAVAQLREALALRPAATELSYVLAQVHPSCDPACALQTQCLASVSRDQVLGARRWRCARQPPSCPTSLRRCAEL